MSPAEKIARPTVHYGRDGRIARLTPEGVTFTARAEAVPAVQERDRGAPIERRFG